MTAHQPDQALRVTPERLIDVWCQLVPTLPDLASLGAILAQMSRRPTARLNLDGLPAAHLRLLHPEPHIHLAVHRHGSREVLLRLLPLVQSLVELAQADVVVSDERAHAPFVGEGYSLPVGGFSLCGVHGIAALQDPARQTSTVRLSIRREAFRGLVSRTADFELDVVGSRNTTIQIPNASQRSARQIV